MVYDYSCKLVESGYCRYTSFVLRQDIDANTYVITKHNRFWCQHFVDWKINIDANIYVFTLAFLLKMCASCGVGKVKRDVWWPCPWLEYRLPRVVRKVKHIEHNNYSKITIGKEIMPRIWQFSHTAPHMSLWVEDKQTSNLPSLSLTTIQIPPWSLRSEMMNKGSWDMARGILGCTIQSENKSQEMWGQYECPALQQDSFAHVPGNSPPAVCAASRDNISVLWW